jgi:hypothetical protein
MTQKQTRCRRQKGNSLIEFALCMTFMLPLLFGSLTVGMGIGRSLQASQVARDVGHMYARSTDFSLVGMQNLVVQIARGLGMTRTGGDGIVILSRVLKVGDAQCLAGGVAVAACSNRTKSVVTQRIVIGNPSFSTSKFATPAPALIAANGDITADNYLKNLSVVATNFNQLLPLLDGEEAYMVESYFKNIDYLSTSSTNGMIYSRAIF